VATTKIGFMKPGAGRSHYAHFAEMIPADLDIDMCELEVMHGSLQDFANQLDPIVDRTKTLAEQRDWQAVMVPGAPVEVHNPGLNQALAQSLSIPFTTALSAGVSALAAYGLTRVLLMTPFDQGMNNLIVEHLERTGLEILLADSGFASEQQAVDLETDVVYQLTRKAVRSHQGFDAIYFQGAVLDPLDVIDEMEAEFGVPVIASNPAMLWSIASQIGKRYEISHKGLLMKEWPAFNPK
jgi:hypothetical protein